jgi:hypothetical protein
MITLTGCKENVVSIVLNPRRDCDVIANGIGKGTTENGRSTTLLKMLTFFGVFALLKSEITPKNGNLHLILKIR